MKTSLLLGVALAAGAALAAQAAPLNGTFSAAVGVAPLAGLLSIGSVLDITGAFATGGTGDLAGVGFGTPVTGLPDPLTLADGQSFSFTLMGFGSFTGTTSLTVVAGPSGARVGSFYALGTFTPSFGGYTPGPASVTAALTQTGGPGSAVSFGFTFASPPTRTDVPAPAALAMFGLGLLGLGLARRGR
jgi:hypothetical protein